MVSDFDQKEWLAHPTGKIPKGTFCKHCARFNARQIACSTVLLKDSLVLLVERAQEPGLGSWDIPGGYLDWDETLEEAAIRELKEETGLNLDLSDIEYLGNFSKPNNSVGNQVIEMYYLATKFSGHLELEVAEVSDAKWFDLDSLPKNVAFDHMKILQKINKNLK
jgi:ADP-ribose pyrophosphatase YjhB (NUDIX family)